MLHRRTLALISTLFLLECFTTTDRARAAVPRYDGASGTQAGQECVNPRDGAVMVWVPAGEFTMGSTDQDNYEGVMTRPRTRSEFRAWRFRTRIAQDDEKPQHTVSLDGYWMYRCEVTVRQYAAFCKATHRKMPAAPVYGWADDNPMVNVDWYDAMAYAAWAKAALPTEAQWEKAACGTDTRRYPWGNDWNPANCGSSVREKASGPRPVGSFPAGASTYGCLDMAGNVWEWCQDWYDDKYYATAPAQNPAGPPAGQTRVIRGGSFLDTETKFYRGALRHRGNPTYRDADYGFRCAVCPSGTFSAPVVASRHAPASPKRPAGPIYLAAFKGDRPAAISFTFDDCPCMGEHIATAVPLLEKYGFRGTFAIITSTIPESWQSQWDIWRQVAQRGHEIANHTISHRNLVEADDQTLDREVNGAYDLILAKIGIAPVTLMYPFNAQDDRVRQVVFQRHRFTRNDQLFYSGYTFTPAMSNQYIDEAIASGKWIVPMIHGFEHNGYMPFGSRDVFDAMLRYVKSREDQLWVETFDGVSRYVRERDQAKLTVTRRQEQRITFTLDGPLDPRDTGQPLTVVIPARNPRAVLVTPCQTGAVTARADAILLDIVPSPVPITVTWR